MSRGGKQEEQPLSEITQTYLNLYVAKSELEAYKKFANQLLDVVRSNEQGKLLWLSDFPNEIEEKHLVHLLNALRYTVK